MMNGPINISSDSVFEKTVTHGPSVLHSPGAGCISCHITSYLTFCLQITQSMHLPVKGIHGSASLCQTRATFYDQWMAYIMCIRTEQRWIMMNHATSLILICTLLWQTWTDYVPWLLMAHCEYHMLPTSECYRHLWYGQSLIFNMCELLLCWIFLKKKCNDCSSPSTESKIFCQICVMNV